MTKEYTELLHQRVYVAVDVQHYVSMGNGPVPAKTAEVEGILDKETEHSIHLTHVSSRNFGGVGRQNLEGRLTPFANLPLSIISKRNLIWVNSAPPNGKSSKP